MRLKFEKDFLSERNKTYLLHKKTLYRLKLILISFVLLLSLLSDTSSCLNYTSCIQHFSYSQSSFRISNLNIILNVKTPSNIIIIEEYTFSNTLNTTVDFVDLFLNMSYSNLSIESLSNKTPLNYETQSSSEIIKVYLDTSIQTNTSSSIRLTYNLASELPLLMNKNPYYMFSFRSTLSYFTEKVRITCRLPEYCYLHETDDFLPYSPFNITTNFLSGTRNTLIWDFNNLHESSVLDIRIFFDEPPKNPLVWLFIVSPTLGLLLGAIISYYHFRRKDQKNTKKIGDLFLSNVQKQLLEIINSKGGKLSQTELCKITGYTRTRISRNLISLEQQGLIRRERWGKNFRIYLEDLGRKVIE